MNDITQVLNRRTGRIETVYKESLLDLANAIIERAVNDYHDAYNAPYTRGQIECFFRSDYFLLLSRGCVSPDSIIKFLKEES